MPASTIKVVATIADVLNSKSAPTNQIIFLIVKCPYRRYILHSRNGKNAYPARKTFSGDRKIQDVSKLVLYSKPATKKIISRFLAEFWFPKISWAKYAMLKLATKNAPNT